MSPSNRPASWPGEVDIGTDRWDFGAQWHPRPDDLPVCAKRLHSCMLGLSELDTRLGHWVRYAEPVEPDVAALTTLLEQGLDKEDPAGETGATISLWNGVEDDDLAAAELTLNCASRSPYVRDHLGLRLPCPAVAPALYQVDTMFKLFDVVISAWQPQWCSVRPRSLRSASDGSFVDVLASWIIYLDRDIYTRVGVVPGIVESINEFSGRGTFLILAPTPEQVSMRTIDGLRRAITFPDEWRQLR